MDQNILNKAQEWTKAPYDENTRSEIQTLIDNNDEKELTDRFYRDLEFGTGGLRGTLGAGTNRMNSYVVRKVSQGLANYMIATGRQHKGIVIGRDSRLQSDVFAETVAGVMVANGIPVYFFEDIHPTPTVSFAIRQKGALSGVMVTASHNPQQYNGYKVFWEDGAQVTPPHDTAIIKDVQKITSLDQVKIIDFETAIQNPLFHVIDQELDPVYLNKIRSLSIHPETVTGSNVRICYSPLHGTGYRLVPEALRLWGFEDVVYVDSQLIPDGHFPTAPFPNPELREAMEPGIKVAAEKDADVLIASDPDADRIGVALKQKGKDYLLLNGNQIASLLVFYVTHELKNTGRMPENPRVVSTIVTTALVPKICASMQIPVDEVLTGFKWIGLKAKEYEESKKAHYIFGCEESHGYNAADFVRDKDAVSSASLFAEMTAYYKSKGRSLVDVLNDIYKEYGYYKESQIAAKFEGKEGADKISAIMEGLRTNPPTSVGDHQVLSVTDIRDGSIKNPADGKEIAKVALPSSNVIVLKLSDEAKIVARPSGTEPKIKFYFTTAGEVGDSIDETITRVEKAHQALRTALSEYIGL